MPGYSVRSKKDGVDFLELGMLCMVCHYLLRKARQIRECGHLYCDECLKHIIQHDGKCVVNDCQVEVKSIDETFEDRATQRDIMRFPVLCQNTQCPWDGTLREYEEKHSLECEYNVKTCPYEGCGQTFKEDKNLNIHVDTCSEKVMPCKFTVIGCSVQANKRQLIEHCRDKVADHINLLHLYLLDIESDTMNSGLPQEKYTEIRLKIRHMEEQLSKIDMVDSKPSDKPGFVGQGAKSKTTDSVSDNWQVKHAELRLRIDRFEETTKELKKMFTNWEMKVHESEAEKLIFQEKRKQLSNSLAQLETQVSLREQSLQEKAKLIDMKVKATYNGVLLWHIDNFNQRRREARDGRVVSFYSHYVYTSRYGYKLRARIYLNGDGTGRGTHISLFFVVCQGEFDGILKWPFTRKVVLKILDQDNVVDVTDAFLPNASSTSYQRPTTPMNIASGIPDFMPLSTLDDPNQGYVKDNSLFVKIQVLDD